VSIASSWDAEYRTGRYVGEPPIPFVAKIFEVLRDNDANRKGTGLYVGCGNGRNFLPLIDRGLDLVGLDLSGEALRQISEQRPDLNSDRLICDDFLTFENGGRQFDYLIALQVFQHGNDARVKTYFTRVAQLLRPGGIFFLRLNSISTQIVRPHTIVERNQSGGFTVRYDDGPKKGLLVHFFSGSEIEEQVEADFRPVADMTEDTTQREPPQSGFWSQWEGAWQRSQAGSSAW
jgi:cyclopropane fatty-acyl-phospholipid synthase-like methyltransferase